MGFWRLQRKRILSNSLLQKQSKSSICIKTFATTFCGNITENEIRTLDIGDIYRFGAFIFKVWSCNPVNCWLCRASNASMQKCLCKRSPSYQERLLSESSIYPLQRSCQVIKKPSHLTRMMLVFDVNIVLPKKKRCKRRECMYKNIIFYQVYTIPNRFQYVRN